MVPRLVGAFFPFRALRRTGGCEPELASRSALAWLPGSVVGAVIPLLARFTLRPLRVAFRRVPTPPSFVRTSLVRIGIPRSIRPALRVCAHRSPRGLRPSTMALLRFYVSTARGIQPVLAGPCGSARSVFRVRPA
jgi:hypothetical protein